MGQMVAYGAGALRAALNSCGGASKVNCGLEVLVVVEVGPSPLPDLFACNYASAWLLMKLEGQMHSI
jgi:hypothetical protein